LQQGIVSLPLVHPIAEVAKNARALADAFRTHNLPYLRRHASSSEPAEQHSGLNSRNLLQVHF